MERAWVDRVPEGVGSGQVAPLIGITCPFGRGVWRLKRDYADAVAAAGGRPVALALFPGETEVISERWIRGLSRMTPTGDVAELELEGAPFPLGVHWHPERTWQHAAAAAALFRGVVAAAAEHRLKGRRSP